MKKVNNKILTIFMIIILVISLIKISENISKAATYNFNLTGNTRANKGDTITFTITANGLTGNVKLTGNNVSLSNTQVWVEKNTVTFTATVTGFPASVTATPVELTDNDYNIVSIEAITKTISEIETAKPQPQPQPPAVTEPETSNGGRTENSQSNQGQSGGTQPQTSSSQSSNSGGTNPSYGTNQGSNQGTINQEQSNPTITSDGEIKSSNNYLKNLQVNVGTLNPEFYRETFEYKIDNIIENEIEITAEAEDEKAVINGLGTIALSTGENIINIEVIAENEQARTYTIIVNKVEETKQSDLRLETLEIETINEENKFENLDIGFNKDTLDYRVTVEDNITDLSILATVNKEGIIIQTEGEKNLIEGENVVTITLTNQNVDENNQENTATINEYEATNIQENTATINEQETTNIQENTVTINEQETTNVQEKTVYTIKVTRKAKPVVEISNNVNEMKIKKIVAGVILIIIITVLVILIIINIKKNKAKKKKFKGKSK